MFSPTTNIGNKKNDQPGQAKEYKYVLSLLKNKEINDNGGVGYHKQRANESDVLLS